jgi:hypothetical protein
MNWRKFVLLGCVVACVFAASTATAQMRGHGNSVPRTGIRAALTPRSTARMPMHRAPMPGSMPVLAGRTTDEAANPPAPGGGHGEVWVNTERGVYHREGSRFYGTTRNGKYMTEQDAIQAGYKPEPKGP